MPLENYGVGTVMRLKIDIRQDGALVDPSAIDVAVQDPSSAVTHYTLAGGAVVKDAVGLYHADFTLTAAGTWTYAVKTTTPTRATVNQTVTAVTTLQG